MTAMDCSELQAFSWYQRASDAGDADGTYHLALCALLLQPIDFGDFDELNGNESTKEPMAFGLI